MVRSDHQALKWLFSFREPKSRIARWIEELSAYDFKVEYRAGRKHGNADGMSRCQDPRECTCPTETAEDLKCGPCRKCMKRAVDMCSSLENEISPVRRVIAVGSAGARVLMEMMSLLWWLFTLPWLWGSVVVLRGSGSHRQCKESKGSYRVGTVPATIEDDG